MKIIISLFLLLIFVIGCANNQKAIAMNEHQLNSVNSSSKVKMVTPELIKEVHLRREKFLKEHPGVILP